MQLRVKITEIKSSDLENILNFLNNAPNLLQIPTYLHKYVTIIILLSQINIWPNEVIDTNKLYPDDCHLLAYFYLHLHLFQNALQNSCKVSR